ncbi:hypothetical protein CEXT_532271 [Caerostris extrusa]|uniref:Uncharacterized protein n=1 Tax=Caerostris extrusa TaxID=172846 RepID=A0AAV4SS07_CAEEX|nr:hypothetical protein CEXT_532271 [Caerostris extrusa]
MAKEYSVNRKVFPLSSKRKATRDYFCYRKHESVRERQKAVVNSIAAIPHRRSPRKAKQSKKAPFLKLVSMSLLSAELQSSDGLPAVKANAVIKRT